MTDNLSIEDRKKTMRAIRGKNTGMEVKIRARLVRLSISGWVMHTTELLGKPDFAFPKEKIAIFLDGCFWHGCPECDKPLPQSNREYWKRKISRNITRDQEYTAELEDNGWMVIRIWEHRLSTDNDFTEVVKEIKKIVESKRDIV